MTEAYIAPTDIDHPGDVTDYIIVGGGSAGCVLAARLSEDPEVQVILLEAGARDTSVYIHLPVTYYKTTGPQFTWGYKTAPQSAQGGIETPFAQARVLGGGSSINAQVYMRGVPEDYDAWRDVHGCSGWGFEDVLPYFVKSEDNERYSGKLHGTSGPLKISDQAYTHPLTYAWLRACQEAGLRFVNDFNSGDRSGCGLYQVTNRAGRRSSAANCYLRLAEKRKNLIVATERAVETIVFDGRRAVGVKTNTAGEKRFFKARREVILASGAIGTPHLLLRSGIGPGTELLEKGVNVVYDAPEVGKNLQDHLDVFMIYELTGPNSYDKYKKLHWQLWAGLQFALFRSGPVTSNVVEGGAFWRVDPKETIPDVQFHFLAGAGVEAGIPAVPSGNGCTLNAYLVRPKSRGEVTLRSADPNDEPVIDPKFLSDPEDLTKTIESVRLGRDIMQQAALKDQLKSEHFPGVNIQSYSELENFVREEARTGYHPVGTCRMGTDDRSVVDTQLRVRGVDGLRIADNSVMPRIISGNTNATAIMIGERAADFLKGNHGECGR